MIYPSTLNVKQLPGMGLVQIQVGRQCYPGCSLAPTWHNETTTTDKSREPQADWRPFKIYQGLVHFAFLRNITLTSVAEHAMTMPVFSLQKKQCQLVKRGVHGNLPCWRSSAGSATLPATRPQLLIIHGSREGWSVS